MELYAKSQNWITINHLFNYIYLLDNGWEYRYKVTRGYQNKKIKIKSKSKKNQIANKTWRGKKANINYGAKHGILLGTDKEDNWQYNRIHPKWDHIVPRYTDGYTCI